MAMPLHASPSAAQSSLSFKSVREILTDELRREILSGALEEGAYLRQRSLARRYHLSEVAVREALRVLESEGFVEIEPRRGARVSRLSVAEVQELWELRILIEKLLTQHAVPACTVEDLARSRVLMQALERERDPVEWLFLNRQFHDCLYRPSGRSRILRFAHNLRNLMERYLRVRLGVLHLYEVANKEHRRILAAYRQRDTALAVKRVEAHLQRTADSVIAFLASATRRGAPGEHPPGDDPSARRGRRGTGG